MASSPVPQRAVSHTLLEALTTDRLRKPVYRRSAFRHKALLQLDPTFQYFVKSSPNFVL
jgi:hypothetical protein